MNDIKTKHNSYTDFRNKARFAQCCALNGFVRNELILTSMCTPERRLDHVVVAFALCRAFTERIGVELPLSIIFLSLDDSFSISALV